MAAKTKKNARCPLQNECERKCEHVGHELDCDYYRNNAVGDNVIPDQEELLKIRNKLDDDKRLEEELKNLPPEDSENKEKVAADVINFSEILGDLSSASEIKKIALGQLFPSKNNLFNVENDITPLAEDIKINGLLSPLTVCPSSEENFYRIISGHRRYKALCSLYKNSIEVPCVIVQPKSAEAEEYMLIQANMTSRQISYQDINKAREKGEKLLLDLKAQGYEFPGKMRKHVADLLKISEAKLAKAKFISENLNEDIKKLSDRDFSFDNKYKVAHWPADMQKKLYDKKLKGGEYFGDVWTYDSKIKAGEDPFVKPKKEKEELHPKNMICCYVSPSKDCDNYENFKTYEGVTINKFGIAFKCDTKCCRYCSYKAVCPAACKVAIDKVKESLFDIPKEKIDIFKVRLALKSLLLKKGFNEAKIKDVAALEGYDFSNEFSSLVTDVAYSYINLQDLLYYLHLLKITPNEFFDIVKNHTDGPYKPENDIKPTWEIYLGEDRDNE